MLHSRARTKKETHEVRSDVSDGGPPLAFCAAITDRIKLIPNIVVVPYRNPFIMAKAIATIDAFSGGSLDVLLPPELRIGDVGLRVNSLGMTETLGPHTLGIMGNQLPEEKRGSFGWAVPGMEHRIVDPVTGEDCPTGEQGEVWVRGYALMTGLYKVERADAFTPDGWYRTGDRRLSTDEVVDWADRSELARLLEESTR